MVPIAPPAGRRRKIELAADKNDRHAERDDPGDDTLLKDGDKVARVEKAARHQRRPDDDDDQHRPDWRDQIPWVRGLG
jgi:hypothetical protein